MSNLDTLKSAFAPPTVFVVYTTLGYVADASGAVPEIDSDWITPVPLTELIVISASLVVGTPPSIAPATCNLSPIT